MMQLDMNLTGSALKRQGQSLALDHAGNDWVDSTIAALRIFCDERKVSGKSTFLFEEFRATRSHALPLSHKAWGSVPIIAVRCGIIRWTGEYDSAKSLKTHAHPVKRWIAL